MPAEGRPEAGSRPHRLTSPGRAAGAAFPAALLILGILLGQKGIPMEDGGEMLTIARLGGTAHPPGMPLLALLSRASWLLGERGLVLLGALCAALSIWLLFRRTGYAGWLLGAAVMVLPAFRARVLAFDAYGLLFLSFCAALTLGRADSAAAGYLTGLAVSIHPAGIMVPAALKVDRFRAATFLGALALGASLYLALPVCSAASAVVDWGGPGTLGSFLRQVSASGYREVYGASMGRFSLQSVTAHLGVLKGMLWPALMLPAAAGALLMAGRHRGRLMRLLLLLLLDMLFVVLVNPMAAGTTQTGWLSLVVLTVLAAEAAARAPRLPVLAMAAAVCLSAFDGPEPLPDQRGDVEAVLASAPPEAGFFISDNDLLYGSWVAKYVRDRRPDIVLLSTGNFSPWFESLARRYNPDLDTSGGLDEAGGPGTPRDSVVARLVRLTVLNNPRRSFFMDF